MAGRISEADKERVRDANRIEQVVGEYVALRTAGGGNLKGLCPFHDEKTPSFTVTPSRGGYHCFGCGEGGDVFSFIQEIEHLTFAEAVQRLADRVGITLTIVEGGTSTAQDRGTRSRLLAANRAAAQFYAEQLRTPGAADAREYLTSRGFDDAAALKFGCGFAPSGWDALVKVLTAQGFSLDELYKVGLARQGRQGPIDAFHRRLVWAIRDAAGDVVGFGARRLFDDDRLEAKYINTSDTPLYRKSQVLFGLDLAKKDIARQRQAVVVEGYTDVMAMHLAGVTTAVASCGTAFGDEHIGVLRRYLLDSEVIRGEVVYTFDGDAAGQKAALKAFDSDQKFAANTFVCVAPAGMDPCELRQEQGDAAVRELVAARTPLFAFAIRETLKQYNLETAEGRVAAAAAAIPMVARIKEPTLRDEYARQLAGWLGAEHQPIIRRVQQQVATDHRQVRPAVRTDRPAVPGQPAGFRRPDPADRRYQTEREALKLVLQQPVLLAVGYRHIEDESFTEPSYAAVHAAITAAGGPAGAVHISSAAWVESVCEQVPAGPLRSLVTELAVERVLHRDEVDAVYAGAVLASLAERVAATREQQLRSDLRRAEADGDQVRMRELAVELMEQSAYRRALATRATGGA